MAKIQTKNGFWHKFFGWFRRHKATASFCAVIIALALYLGGSWAVLQVQIHFERDRYMATKSLVAHLNRVVSGNASTDSLYQNCSYTDNGGGFAPTFLGCEVNADINFRNVPRTSVIQVSNQLRAEVVKMGLHPNENQGGMSSYDLSNYVFKYQGITCGFSTTYYPNDTSTSERYVEAIQTGADLYANIVCSGPAKAEYFPVVKD